MGSVIHKPSPNRGKRGHFLPGNKAAVGRGNPAESHVTSWRRAFTRSVTAADVTKAMQKLLDAVDNGESWAIKELLDRTLGKADQRHEITGDGGGPVETQVTLRLKFADRQLIDERPLLGNGAVGHASCLPPPVS